MNTPPAPGARDAKAPAPPKGTGLDVMTQNAGENVRKVHARELAANVVTALFRLVKLSTLHSLDNQAMVRQIDETVQLVSEYGQRTDHNVSILFAHGSVFVGGQLLRANRGTYEGALELGEILSKVGAAEIGIMRDARASDFLSFASALADSLRTAKPQPIRRPSPRILLRSMNAAALLRENISTERVDPNVQVARIYASAVVIMRRFFEDLRRGKYELPQRVKRVAQRLVDLSTGETPAFLGVTAARNANHDEAGRAVNTAILSLAMTRQITTDMVQLSRVAMAALLFDCARARLAGVAGQQGGSAVIPQLSEQQEAEAPAATAVVLTALGRVNEPSVMRTVIAYESHWEKRKARLGALYRGLRQPSLQARIIAAARAFNDLLTPAPGVTPPTADEAIAKLQQDAAEPAERTVLRLLVGALGIFPTGTVVQLTTGEVAIVVQAPSNPSLYSQPRVQIVVDEAGGQLPRPLEVDLAAKRRPGDPARQIKQVLATADDPSSAGLRSWAAGFASAGPASMVGNPSSYLWSGTSSFPGGSTSQSSAPPYQTPSMPPSYPQTPFPNTLQSASGGSGQRVTERPSSQKPQGKGYSSMPPPGAVPARMGLEPAPGRAAPSSAMPPPAAPDPDPDDENSSTRAVSWEEQEKLVESAREAPASPEACDKPTGPPTADGDLNKTPFVHLLIYMLDQGLTGTALFTSPDGATNAIYFHQGAPAKVRTAASVAPLDRVLVEQGLLDEATLRGTLMEVSKRRILHGRHLVMKGLLDRETVLASLRLQVLRKVTHLFELEPATRYAYYEGQNLLASYGGPELLPCEPLAAIMEGIRARAGDPRVDATLARLAGRQIGLHVEADLRRFQLQRDEKAVADLIRARRLTMSELLDAGAAQPRVVRLTVYALALTRHLDLGVPGRPPVGAGRPLATEVLTQPAKPAAPAEQAPKPRARTGTLGGDAPLAPQAAATPAAPPAARPRAQSPAEIAEQQPPSVRAPMEAFRSTTKLPRVMPAPSLDAAAHKPEDAEPASSRAPDVEPSARPGLPGQALRPTTKMPRQVMPTLPEGQPPSSKPAPTPAPAAVFAMPPSPPQRAISAPPTPPPASPQRTPPPPPVSQRTPPPPPQRTAPPPSPQRAAGTAPPPSPAVASTSSPPAPSSAKPDLTTRRAEIEKRAQTIDAEDYFQMLGISRDAPSDQMRGAYFSLAKAWHPDRLPGELIDLKPQVARIFARLSEAYQTLNDAGKRGEYLSLLGQGGALSADQEKIARVVDAALEFQKAEILLKKHDLPGAEELARRAVQADPEQPEYMTLLVWIQAQRRGDPPGLREGVQSPHFDDLIKTLDAIIAKEMRYERAIYFRGVLQKRAGRTDKAIRDFRLSAEINPKNIDAVREVRLHEMRKRSGGAPPEPPPEGGGGIFGKFFKR